jgi:hypothetical protein
VEEVFRYASGSPAKGRPNGTPTAWTGPKTWPGSASQWSSGQRRPAVITAAEAAAGTVPGVVHAHARTRSTGRTLRVEIEGWVDPDLSVTGADAIGQQVAQAIASQLPEAGSFIWTPQAAPAR